MALPTTNQRDPNGPRPTAPRGRPRLRLRTGQREALLGLGLILPTLLVVGIIIVRPLVESLWLSLHEQDLLSFDPEPSWVGLSNYLWMFTSSWFLPVLRNTAVVTVVVVGLQLVFSVALALLLDFDFPGQRVVRTLLIAPWAIPVIVAAFMWRWILDPSVGPLSYYLEALGLLPEPIAWLGNRTTALPAVTLVMLWKGLPFMLLAMIAGVQQVPKELREAARVDGANGWHEVRHVVLPSMRHVIVLMAILRCIFVFNHFDLIYLLTGGGPGDATLVMAIQAVNLGVNSFRFGRAATITSFMFLVLMALSLVYLRIANRRGGGADT